MSLVPGESLFLPARWWHDVYSSSGSVAVSINLVTARIHNQTSPNGNVKLNGKREECDDDSQKGKGKKKMMKKRKNSSISSISSVIETPTNDDRKGSHSSSSSSSSSSSCSSSCSGRKRPRRMTAFDLGFACCVCKKGPHMCADLDKLWLCHEDEALENKDRPYYCSECKPTGRSQTLVSVVDFMCSIAEDVDA